jgi:predicted choloylglycine hydrolase
MLCRWMIFPVCVAVLALSGSVSGQVKHHFPTAKHGPATLTHQDGIAVVRVQGTPAEVGEQLGTLLADTTPKMQGTLNDFLTGLGMKDSMPAIMKLAGNIKTNFHPDHLAELQATAKATKMDLEFFLFVNAAYDLLSGFGCSTMIVNDTRSSTGAVLFARNFDYPNTKGLIDQTAVFVVKVKDKHAFASITLAPMAGVISGMNDAGLCVTINEIHLNQSSDKSKFNWKGEPTQMLFRRVLEECSTLEEAETFLNKANRMTTACMSICDTKGGCVFELTPKSVVRRDLSNGFCCCTNHFCSDALGLDVKTCPRMDKLLENQAAQTKLGVDELFSELGRVNQKEWTLHSMVFEPTARKVHLKVSDGKSSATESKTVTFDFTDDLKPAK